MVSPKSYTEGFRAIPISYELFGWFSVWKSTLAGRHPEFHWNRWLEYYHILILIIWYCRLWCCSNMMYTFNLICGYLYIVYNIPYIEKIISFFKYFRDICAIAQVLQYCKLLSSVMFDRLCSSRSLYVLHILVVYNEKNMQLLVIFMVTKYFPRPLNIWIIF